MAACAIATAFFTPATPAAWIVAVCAVFGATAIGWNGVFLAQVARFAPPGEASAATAGSLFFTYAGVLVFPTLFALLVEGGAGYAVAFLVCAIPAASCATWLLALNLDAVPASAAREPEKR
jgi:MFS family permease